MKTTFEVDEASHAFVASRMVNGKLVYCADFYKGESLSEDDKKKSMKILDSKMRIAR